jgi:hypothetical protein
MPRTSIFWDLGFGIDKKARVIVFFKKPMDRNLQKLPTQIIDLQHFKI